MTLIKKPLPRLLFALGIGLAGGLLFVALNMPLPWMIGAMIATTVAAMAGLPLQTPGRLRMVMIAVLGVMLGSAFTPETLGKAAAWPYSLTAVLIFSAIVTMIVTWFLHKRGGYGPVTAYFSAAPGGLNDMMMIGGAHGGDERIISLMHSIRIMVTVLIIPFWLRLFEGYEPTFGGLGANPSEWPDALGAVLLIACVGLGLIVGQKLHLPAPALVGPMILSAGVHMSGLTAAAPPGVILAGAQVVVGTAIGCRFLGFPPRRVIGVLGTGFATTLFMLVLAGAIAFWLGPILGISTAAILLALSPGGLAEMSLISLAMGIDVAFVSTHHIARVVLVVGLAPLGFYALRRISGFGKQSRPEEFGDNGS